MQMYPLMACSACFLLAGQTSAGEEIWRLTELETPESVLFDADRQVMYLSSIVGDPLGKDGAGYISRLAPDGTVEDREWVTGLDAPKGMVMRGDTLFVSDIDRLVAIDVETGEISGTWPADGAIFLNDTAVDAQGRVFVSDMLTNRIHVLDGDALSIWAEGEALMHPNGLAVDDGTLVIAPWGSGMNDDFTTEVAGHLLAADLETGEISDYGSGAPVGNLDGIEADGAGSWLVTDWIAGALYRIHPDGSFEQLLDLPPGSADLEFIADRNVVLIPMMLDGEMIAYGLD